VGGEEGGDFAAVCFGGVDVEGGDEGVGGGGCGGGEGAPETVAGCLGGSGDAEEGVVEEEGGLEFKGCVEAGFDEGEEGEAGGVEGVGPVWGVVGAGAVVVGGGSVGVVRVVVIVDDAGVRVGFVVVVVVCLVDVCEVWSGCKKGLTWFATVKQTLQGHPSDGGADVLEHFRELVFEGWRAVCEDGYEKIAPDPQERLFDAVRAMEVKGFDEFSVLLVDGYADGHV